MHEGHFDTSRAGRLDSEGRLRELRPEQLLRDVAGIASGMTCVDLGCGTGTFSLPALALVGETGTVYAVDDSAEMLGYLRAKDPPSNLKVVHSDVGRTDLPDETADVCLLAFILHEVNNARRLAVETLRLLKPGGIVLAVEWQAELDSPGPPPKIRLSEAQIKGLLQEAGFSAFEYATWSPNHYWAMACRPAIPQS